MLTTRAAAAGAAGGHTVVTAEPLIVTGRHAALTIRAFEESDDARWNDYVSEHAFGSPFHLTAWKKSIESAFGYKAMYLMAFQGRELCGVLPLFLIENLLIKRALISIPFAVYGGALTDSPEVAEAFRNHLVDLGRKLSVEYVELRNGHPEQVLGFSHVRRYVTFTQDIGPDDEQIMRSIPRKTRYMVRKSLKEEFTTEVRKTEYLNFSKLYSQNLRRLGTPAFPGRYFEALLHHFKGSIDIREVMLGGKLASAVLTLYFRDQVMPYYGASDPEFKAQSPNNFMYFDLMRWGGQRGYRTFDFGRSKIASGGSYDFKAHWGMKERILPYEMLLVKRKSLPNFTPRNPAFRLPIKVMQKLPLPLTRIVGPHLVKLVP